MSSDIATLKIDSARIISNRMRTKLSPETERKFPSLRGLAWYRVRRLLLSGRRTIENQTSGIRAWPKGDAPPNSQEFTVETPLFSSKDESLLELGKVQNLRLIAQKLNGVSVPGGQTFSFWAQVGFCGSRQGFVRGRTLQEGCLVPAVGGGICQLTNSLYQAARQASLEIIERHPHTQIIPGSAAERDEDATVAYNHVDLRFRGPQDFQIKVHLSDDTLFVSILSAPAVKTKGLASIRERRRIDPTTHECTTCGQTRCPVHPKDVKPHHGRTVWMVDEAWPEFAALDSARDLLLAPLNAKRFHRPSYDWPTDSFAKVRYATTTALKRGLRQRKLSSQGADRQKGLLDGFAALAQSYTREIPFDATHLVIDINLLPFLHRLGVLGGRTFDVLLTRYPMETIQILLDKALTQNPNRALLGDFRADLDLVRDEAIALSIARRIITPNVWLATQFPNSELIPWAEVNPLPWEPGPAILFPGPTVARKGAYEVREAAKSLGIPVNRLGSDLEGPYFWSGVDAHRAERANPFRDIFAVVQPSVIDMRPRLLREALASGIPVIATAQCGLPSHPNLHVVQPGDVEAIIGLLQALGGR